MSILQVEGCPIRNDTSFCESDGREDHTPSRESPEHLQGCSVFVGSLLERHRGRNDFELKLKIEGEEVWVILSVVILF